MSALAGVSRGDGAHAAAGEGKANGPLWRGFADRSVGEVASSLVCAALGPYAVTSHHLSSAIP
jgi:hypothetical protein